MTIDSHPLTIALSNRTADLRITCVPHHSVFDNYMKKFEINCQMFQILVHPICGFPFVCEGLDIKSDRPKKKIV